MELKIGDRVNITNPDKIYNSYSFWVKENAPDYLKKFKMYAEPSLKEEIQLCTDFVVVATGKHSSVTPIPLCLIQNYAGAVYLFAQEGLTKTTEDFNVNEFVCISDPRYVYPVSEKWKLKNIPYFLNNKNKDVLPSKDKAYCIISIHPKANFYPFNQQFLYVVQEENSQNVFIVEEMGLFHV
ncbi:MAG: hypothetical protein ACI37Z_05030 [Candidatus Gastranaerophilaceae bacterium]